jgi:D-3-phosphoglycerate dehydrogenase
MPKPPSAPDQDPIHPGAVVVAEDVWGDAFDELATRYRVELRPDLWKDADALGDAVHDARALVVRNRTTVDRKLLEHARHLELVARAGVGLDNIDVAAADELGIVVVAPLGANARSVAEHSLALALALARDVVGNDRRVRDGRWERHLGIELSGRTWGIVGLGATGRALASLVGALGMTGVGFDPAIPPDEQLPPGIHERLDTIDQLLDRADVVSLHVPLTPATASMVDARFLASMRPGAYLINVSRGGLVDEEALCDALESGQLGGAGIDVRAEEPPVPGRLERHPHAVLSPHVAGLTHESQEQVTTILARNLDLVLGGGDALQSVGTHGHPARPRP